MMPKKLLYLVVWPNGHEERIWVEHWLEMSEMLMLYVGRLGLPDLIYRKE